MKVLNVFFVSAMTLAFPLNLLAQDASIVGRWQLVKKTTCLDGASVEDDATQQLLDDMHSHSGPGAQIVSFRDNSTAEESTRILNSNRSANQKKFFYKFNGDMLLILDKKTQTISDNYMVDKFTADSLVLSNSARPCEIRMFVKIKDSPSN